MYAEASSPAKPGQKASLQSKNFPSVKHRCMKFFYSMYGTGIGALRVFLKTVGTGYEKQLWMKLGQQGPGWKEGQIEISSKFTYQVNFPFILKEMI